MIESKKIDLEIIHAGVGPISESDVLLASASNAVIVGFNVKTENQAAAAAKREGIQIKLYSIIYELIDQIKEAVGIHVADVAGVQPTVAERLGRGLRPLPVTLHYYVAADHELAELAGRDLAIVVVDHSHFDARKGRTDRTGLLWDVASDVGDRAGRF